MINLSITSELMIHKMMFSLHYKDLIWDFMKMLIIESKWFKMEVNTKWAHKHSKAFDHIINYVRVVYTNKKMCVHSIREKYTVQCKSRWDFHHNGNLFKTFWNPKQVYYGLQRRLISAHYLKQSHGMCKTAHIQQHYCQFTNA